MDKVMDLRKAISRIKDGDTVLIGCLGSDPASVSVLACMDEGVRAKGLLFVTLDAEMGSDPSFQKMLAGRSRGLIRPPAQRKGTPPGVPCEVSPQDVLVERIRAGGSGIPAFFVVGDGSPSTKPRRMLDGKECILEKAIRGDVAVIRVKTADDEGNCRLPAGLKDNAYLGYAAHYTIVVADEIVPAGKIDPEHVILPGILVNAVTTAGPRRNNSGCGAGAQRGSEGAGSS